ncbi:MAG: ABC transporter ATP-binding protein [Nitrospina sp.]|jgi:heme exporter protein A|nr:ABC transporter ATP-binding protein [Nitrospina sp.]MBT5257295.1 ABC transporter ATP-binding protein [Nitrospina sp.]MBT7521475.1 ABC transporter ATP-binding protein [Nitrospina sp.]|tara:strand:- start:2256 stop:2990 length:735 start_codon:yes stop_codon:yes gene_type:complete
MNEQNNPTSSHPIIQVQELRKDFGYLQALSGVSFNLNKGDFLTIFGPNGAGKTTLIKILTGLMRPTSGSAIIDGFDALEGNSMLRSRIGVISHATCLYPDLTALENLLFYAKLYGLDDPEERANKSISASGLQLRRHDPVRIYSRGMQQRLAIARATLHDPSVLFLDEPFTGLDLTATNGLKNKLHDLHKDKRTLIMTTHDISCGLEMCDKVAIQNKGKFLFLESIDRIDRESFETLYTETLEK